MPPKRTGTHRAHSNTSSDSSSVNRPSKRRRGRSSSSSGSEPLAWDGTSSKRLRVYLVQAKLDEETVSELYGLIDRFGERPSTSAEASSGRLDFEVCDDISEADLVITAIRMRRRLERHLDWKLAKQKAIVTPDWLRDSIENDRPASCGEYAALSELQEETVEHCPENVASSNERDIAQASSPRNTNLNSPLAKKWIDTTSPGIHKNWNSRYACTRASPLVCPNQELVAELGILCRERELEGLQINSLGYQRAIGVIKSYPHPITREGLKHDIAKLPYLGTKIITKVEEFTQNGYIEECRSIQSLTRFKALSAFTTIYGIGPVKARQLFDIGLRSIEDMERYFEVEPGTDIHTLEAELVTPNGKLIISKDKLPDISIKVALALRTELDTKIPRQEVEEIHAVIMRELEIMQPGCVSTIVGGYRRGKQMSNDVDIVISHPDQKTGAEKIKGLCTRFAKHLYKRGLVTHLMHLSGFHAPNALRTGHWDSLEKALTVCILPSDSKRTRIHRRLDLIFAAPESYWTAVVGWTGSKMFERDLRLWAKVEKGMKFDSTGITRRHDSKVFYPRSEKEVFDLLGLEWIDPIMRNADV